MEIKKNSFHEVEDVATILGKSPEFVRSLCRNQKIRASKIGKRWVIPKTEVDKILMLDPGESSQKTNLIITKLEAENMSLQMQLNAVRTFLAGASTLLEIK